MNVNNLHSAATARAAVLAAIPTLPNTQLSVREKLQQVASRRYIAAQRPCTILRSIPVSLDPNVDIWWTLLCTAGTRRSAGVQPVEKRHSPATAYPSGRRAGSGRRQARLDGGGGNRLTKWLRLQGRYELCIDTRVPGEVIAAWAGRSGYVAASVCL